MQGQRAERDRVWEEKYKLRHQIDHGDALVEDIVIFSYAKMKQLFNVKSSKHKKILKRVLKKAAAGAVEGYNVTVDDREALQHKGTQCVDGPSPQKRLKVTKRLGASSSVVAALAKPEPALTVKVE
jgi:hypothetical protein